jgi:hypothetical protein
LQITPNTALSANTAYTLTIDGLCDNGGNVITATNQGFTTSSTTDTTAPTLLSVTPVANATAVSVTTPVVWTFSEPVWFALPSMTNSVYLSVGGGNNKLSGDLTCAVSSEYGDSKISPVQLFQRLGRSGSIL